MVTISSPSISTNFGFFFSYAEFLVVLIVLNSNMAIKITSEMKQWINIATLRHASFPVIFGEGYIQIISLIPLSHGLSLILLSFLSLNTSLLMS